MVAKRSSWIKIALLLASAGLLSPQCSAIETIYWLTFDYPPAYFVAGPHKGEGFADVSGRQFQLAIKDFKHSLMAGISVSKLFFLWQQTDKTYCVPSVGPSTRALPNTLFSKAMVVGPGVGIIVRKTELSRFIKAGETRASLDKLLQDPALRFGAAEYGTFGTRISRLIEQHKKSTYIYERARFNPLAMAKMVAFKRLDYVIDFSFSVQTVFNQLAQEGLPDTLIFLPLLESEKINKGYAICNDTPVGRQVISEINQVLTTDAYKTAVTGRLLELLPENTRDEYRTLNFQFIGQ